MIYCIDIDGTLCDDLLGDYDNSIPYTDAVNKVNRLYDEGHIIKTFTGRGSKTGINWREFTEKQLKSRGVKYHELIFGKPVADIFIDDKSINARDWLCQTDSAIAEKVNSLLQGKTASGAS